MWNHDFTIHFMVGIRVRSYLLIAKDAWSSKMIKHNLVIFWEASEKPWLTNRQSVVHKQFKSHDQPQLLFKLSDLLPAHKTIGFEAGVGWGGLGWVGVGVGWYQPNVFLPYLIFTCTSTWTWCYATWPALTWGWAGWAGWGGVIPTQRLPTLLDLHLYFYMNLMLRYLTCFNLGLGGLAGVGWGNTNPTSSYPTWSSLVLLHELDATLLDLL